MWMGDRWLAEMDSAAVKCNNVMAILSQAHTHTWTQGHVACLLLDFVMPAILPSPATSLLYNVIFAASFDFVGLLAFIPPSPRSTSLLPSPSSDPIWSENILAACWLETACGLGIWISAGAGGSISSAPHSCRIFEPILWLHLHTDYGKLLGQNIRATRSQCSSRILVSPTRCPFRSLWSLALALLVRQQRFGFRQLFSVFHCASVSLLFLFCCFLWATATSEWAMNISGI